MSEFSNYPNQIDTTTELPKATDNVTPVKAESFNRLRDAIVAIENELGVQPSSTFSTVKDRLDALTNSIGNGGGVNEGTVDMIPGRVPLRDSVDGGVESRLVDGFIFNSSLPVYKSGLLLVNDTPSTSLVGQSPPVINQKHNLLDNGQNAMLEWIHGPILDNNALIESALSWKVILRVTEGNQSQERDIIKIDADGNCSVDTVLVSRNPYSSHMLGWYDGFGPGRLATWDDSMNSVRLLAWTSELPTMSSIVGQDSSAAIGTIGSSNTVARADHTHRILTSLLVPNSIATVGNVGSQDTLARSDHQHAHGNHSVSTMHAAASSVANGFMDTSSVIKLTGIEDGAQACTFINVQTAISNAPGALDLVTNKLINVGLATNTADAVGLGQVNDLIAATDYMSAYHCSIDWNTSFGTLMAGDKKFSVVLAAGVNIPFDARFFGVELDLNAAFVSGIGATFVARIGINGDEDKYLKDTDISGTSTVYFPAPSPTSLLQGDDYRIGTSVNNTDTIYLTIESNQDLITTVNGFVTGMIILRAVHLETFN